MNLEIVERESVKILIVQLIGAVQIAERIESNSDLNEESHSSIWAEYNWIIKLFELTCTQLIPAEHWSEQTLITDLLV